MCACFVLFSPCSRILGFGHDYIPDVYCIGLYTVYTLNVYINFASNKITNCHACKTANFVDLGSHIYRLPFRVVSAFDKVFFINWLSSANKRNSVRNPVVYDAEALLWVSI